jgi:RND superfamily putative drug exporter
MHVIGRWNWWAPEPLAWLHDRFGISEGPSGEIASVEQVEDLAQPDGRPIRESVGHFG